MAAEDEAEQQRRQMQKREQLRQQKGQEKEQLRQQKQQEKEQLRQQKQKEKEQLRQQKQQDKEQLRQQKQQDKEQLRQQQGGGDEPVLEQNATSKRQRQPAGTERRWKCGLDVLVAITTTARRVVATLWPALHGLNATHRKGNAKPSNVMDHDFHFYRCQTNIIICLVAHKSGGLGSMSI